MTLPLLARLAQLEAMPCKCVNEWAYTGPDEKCCPPETCDRCAEIASIEEILDDTGGTVCKDCGTGLVQYADGDEFCPACTSDEVHYEDFNDKTTN